MLRGMHRPFFIAIVFAVACGTTPVPANRHPPAPIPPVDIASGAPGELAITRIAHASVLIELGGMRVLTDPWFTDSAHYHHGEPLGIALTALPHLDAVVVSHGHYDHYDIDAFAAYPDKRVPMIVAPGLRQQAREAGFVDVRELAPWQQTQIGALTITAAPGAHGVTEVTYVLSVAGNTVYFGGDTRLTPALREIAQRFPSIQVALLSVNGLRAMGTQQVMNAEQAALLVGVLHAAVAIPIHYRFHGSWLTDTFVLSYDGTPERFVRAAARTSPSTIVRVLDPGQRLVIDAGRAQGDVSDRRD